MNYTNIKPHRNNFHSTNVLKLEFFAIIIDSGVMLPSRAIRIIVNTSFLLYVILHMNTL